MIVECTHESNGTVCGYRWETKYDKIPKCCPKCKQYDKIKKVDGE